MRVDQIEDLLNEFDFDKVKKVMDCLEWKYHDSVNEGVSIGELRRMARRLLENVFKAPAQSEYTTSCGGFEAARYMYPGDLQVYLDLKFVVADRSNPVC